ncbi:MULTISPECIES: gephyrin-like molybdotransferase Glp [unclassified Aminobacter]|uniref:molybdopterin molybdotransferase MoeA n=1 Tax=unclassified Aminobacter TaxID=2644704 RepID=UPI00046467DF|nr:MULTISPECIES: gephyrin-like molybdotransferase Glp [unclassified Aminobacter]TWH33533.1 molybdopterin molybdotransferase [Aminobacter sp. J15]
MAQLLPVDEALQRLLAGVEPLGSEQVSLAEAVGRVLASDLHARRTQPPFPASAMDGYAVRAEDIATLPAYLRPAGESVAGKRFSGTLQPGEAVRIFTGAPVPEGADTVLLQEDAIVHEDGRIEAMEATARGRHIRKAGLDFSEGEKLLAAGRVLDAAALALAAAANHPVLDVARKPVVAILATGTELVAPGATPGPDQIVASNTYAIMALVQQAGGRSIDLGIVSDDLGALDDAIRRARESGADVLVTLGGASVGDHDLVKDALGAAGMELDFWKIAMRPGKPLMYGRLGELRVLGLPGNPVSSIVCGHLFLKPLVAALTGQAYEHDIRSAVLGTPMGANESRRDYVRAVVASAEHHGDQLVATPFPTQDSSMLKTLAEANALIIREPHAPPADAGAPCKVLMLR